VGRSAIGKSGVVRDPEARRRSIAAVSAAVISLDGWTVSGCVESPIKGGAGNVEFLLGARRDG